jgi:hypothetical protein
MARTYGCWGAGPITEPKDLIKTVREAMNIMKARSVGQDGLLRLSGFLALQPSGEIAARHWFIHP